MEEVFDLKLLEQQLQTLPSEKRDESDPLLRSSPSSHSQPNLFEICERDRHRILSLLKELLDSQDQVEILRQQLETERMNFKEERSKLYKKLDCLSEKYEKALSVNESMRETYSDKFKLLEDQISSVSDQLENSMTEVSRLRELNAKLVEENLALNSLQSDSATVITSYRNDILKLKEQAMSYKEKEKDYKRQLKQVRSTRTVLTGSTTKNPEHKRDLAVSSNTGNSSYKLTGAGDYGRNSSHTQDSLNSSVTLIYAKNLPRDFGSETKKTNCINSSSSRTQVDSNNFFERTDFDEKSMLESLFFRF